jgi:hypothetical protein
MRPRCVTPSVSFAPSVRQPSAFDLHPPGPQDREMAAHWSLLYTTALGGHGLSYGRSPCQFGLRSIIIETQYKTDPRSASLASSLLASTKCSLVQHHSAIQFSSLCSICLLLPATTQVPYTPSALSANPTLLSNPRLLHLLG